MEQTTLSANGRFGKADVQIRILKIRNANGRIATWKQPLG
jgi:hypothetical protein